MAPRHLATLAALTLAVSGAAADAGPLLIAPTMVEVAPGRRGAAIEVTNVADVPSDIQFRAFAWSQDGTRDRLEPTDDLIVSPPIATLPPHGKQVFRVLATGDTDTSTERTYRLKLNELPRAGTPTVAINIEFSLPVFFTPRGATPRLEWHPAASPSSTVEIGNRGARRIRVAGLALVDGDGRRAPIAADAVTYILAGATRRFAIPPGTRLAPGTRLIGVSDAGPIDVPLAVLAAR